MRKIWDKIVQWLLSIPSDKRLHFVAGLLVGAFCCLSLGVEWCWWPAMLAGFLKEFFDVWTSPKGEGWDWGDLLATTLGGLVIWGFQLLGMWWH